MRSEPRPRTTRLESPSPCLRCKLPDFGDSASNNHHPSPNPPKVRANQVQLGDMSENRPPSAASSDCEQAPHPAGTLQFSAIMASPILLHDVPDPVAHQRETRQQQPLPADRRFRPGRVYSRRARAGTTPRPEARPKGCNQVVRFCPGLVYSRRRARGPGAFRPCRERAHPEQTIMHLEVEAGSSSAHDARQATSVFVAGVSHSLPQPLLQVPLRRATPPQRRKKAVVPSCRSVRIVARCWPRGDTQARARQVLMKRLGILEEGLNSDDLLLRYFSLFKGHSPMLLSRP